MNHIKCNNDWWITIILGILLLIVIRVGLPMSRIAKLENLLNPVVDYENEKIRLTKRYDETNMRINEIHQILSDKKR